MGMGKSRRVGKWEGMDEDGVENGEGKNKEG